jgi:lipopolysaccharide export system permease protein
MAPIAALLATLLSLTALKRSNELGAFFFAGVSRFRVARPVLLCALAVSLLSLAVNERVAPLANRAGMDILRGAPRAPDQGGTGASTLVGTQGIWLIMRERVIHIRNVEKGGTLLISPTVLTFTGSDFTQLATRVDAPEGRWDDGEWVLDKAMTRTFSGDVPSQVGGPRTEHLRLGISPREFFKVRRKPEEMTRKELLDYVRDLRMAGLPSFRFAVRVHRNLSVGLLPFVFVLIALAVAFVVPVRGGVPLGAAVSILTTMVFWSLYSFTLSLGNAGTLPPALAAWGMTVLFTAAGLAALAATKRVRLN